MVPSSVPGAGAVGLRKTRVPPSSSGSAGGIVAVPSVRVA
jgi:hypothetical protein